MQTSSERNETINRGDLRHQIADGLLYTHSRLNANAKKTLEAASFLYALIELLEEKGLLSIEELDARKEVVAERLLEQYRQDGNGVMLQDPEYDKYGFAQAGRDRLRQPGSPLPGSLLPIALCPVQTGHPRGHRAVGPGPALPDRPQRPWHVQPPGS